MYIQIHFMNVAQIFDQIPNSLYWGFIFVSALIENIFPPYPGDTVTVFASSLVGNGKISFLSLTTSLYLGSMLGAIFMYFMGTHVLNFFATKIKWKQFQSLTDKEHINKAHDWFEKYGILAIIISRFSAGIRFFVAIVAGVVKMNIFIFSLAFTIGTILWNAVLIYFGYALGKNWSDILNMIKGYYVGFFSILSVICICIFIFHKLKKSKNK